MEPIQMYLTQEEADSLNVAIDEKLRRLKHEMEALQLEYNRLEIIKMTILKKLEAKNNGN